MKKREGASVDITDRKQAEESLRQADLRHRRFLAAVPVGVMRWSRDRVLLDANDTFLRTVGYSREELLSGRLCLPDLTPEDYRQKSDEALAELLSTGVCGPFEKAYRRKDGSTVPVLVSSVISGDEDCSDVTSFVLDLTAQKRTEWALRESEQRLRLHIENTSLALIGWDREFVVTDWSDRAERIFGWTASEAVGRHIFELPLVYGDDLPAVQDVMRRLTDGVTRQTVSLHRNCTKDCRVLNCRWHNSVLHDEHGRLTSVLSLVEDCTASIQTEQALRDAKQLAEEANTAKRQFLANMSHEMRTPLTAIVGFTELLARPELSVEKQRSYVHAVGRNTRMLLKLVDHVLDFSKIEAGKVEVELADYSLWQILQDVLSATSVGAEQKHLHLEVAYQYPLPDRIRTDPLRLWQILVNLVGNAIKFTERGGVWIFVSLEPGGPAEQRLRFTVSDTGTGIRPEWQDHLFEPFFQGDVAFARRQAGVGLGLPIAARLAELLGSRLELGSQAVPGTRFTFTVDPGPLEGRRMLSAPPAENAEATEEVGWDGEDRLEGRVLLAEDAADTQELLRIYLETAGLRVDVANDGLAAVRQALTVNATDQPYDLILLDLQMPELDGYEAARLLRASAWPGPILALSAHTTSDHRDRCRDAGFDQFLAKPISLESLLTTVRRYLGRQGSCRAEAPGVTRAPKRTAKVLRVDGLPSSPHPPCEEIGTGRGGDEMGLAPSRNRENAAELSGREVPVPIASPTRSVPSTVLPTRVDSPGQTVPRLEAERSRLLALFADQLPQRLTLLEQGLDQQDRGRLAQTAHQLAGAAGQFGNLQLASASQLLEQQALAGAAWEALSVAFAALREVASAAPVWHAPPTAASSPPVSAQPTETAKRRYRVLLAEDDELVRAALRSLVNSLVEFQVVAEAANGREALACLEQHHPEIVLMDIAMPDLDGLNATARVVAVSPHTKVIILSAHAREDTVLQALQAGAVGYLLKNASTRELEQALSAVTRGETYYCAAVSQHVITACVPGGGAKPSKRLTPRQLEVLKRIAEGDSTKMIARKLKISVKTAEHHRANLMKLLDIHETASLVRYAIELGLVAPEM